MFQTGLHEINFRLCSVNFTWAKPSWHLLETRLQRTLLEDASTEIHIRLHSMNFTWDYTWNLLLRLGSREFYLSLHPLNFTWMDLKNLISDWAPKKFTWYWTPWNWFQTAFSELYLGLNLVNELYFCQALMNFTWGNLHTLQKRTKRNISKAKF